jgi:hypothetical protein
MFSVSPDLRTYPFPGLLGPDVSAGNVNVIVIPPPLATVKLDPLERTSKQRVDVTAPQFVASDDVVLALVKVRLVAQPTTLQLVMEDGIEVATTTPPETARLTEIDLLKPVFELLPDT